MKTDTEIALDNTIEIIQKNISELNNNIEKIKNDAAKLKVHLLRVEKAILINIAIDQKKNTMQIKNLIEADLKNDEEE